MTYFSHTLNQTNIEPFSSERDPLGERNFRIGDRVVICSRDRRIFLETTWCAMDGSCTCGSTETLAQIQWEDLKPEAEKAEAIYEHRPFPIPEKVDLSRKRQVGLPIPRLLVPIALIALITLSGISVYQVLIKNKKPEVLPLTPPPEPDHVPDLVPDPEPVHVPDPVPDSLPVVPMKKSRDKPKETTPPPPVVLLPGPPADLRSRFRNEYNGQPQGEFENRFAQNRIRQIGLYLDLKVKHQPGILELRVYEPNGHPMLRNGNSLLRKQFRENELKDGLNVTISRDSQTWPLGSYRVELWWQPELAEEAFLLKKELFEVTW